MSAMQRNADPFWLPGKYRVSYKLRVHNALYAVLWLYAVIENFAPYYGTVYAALRSYRRNYGKTGITVQTVIYGGKSYKIRWVNRSNFEARVKVHGVNLQFYIPPSTQYN